MISGIDTAQIDQTVRPQDDLFQHVNGVWLATAEIPADRARDGEFMRLHDQAEKDVHAIVTELVEGIGQDADGRKIADLYQDFMDESAIEAAGVAPIANAIADVATVSTREGLFNLLGSMARDGLPGTLGPWVDTDSADSSRYILNFSQSGLGLPDEAYYREEQFEPIRDAYFVHVQKMLGLAGLADSERITESVRTIEQTLAKSHWDRTETRDVTKTYNPVSREELEALTPGYDWDAWLAGANAAPRALANVVMRQPSYAQAMAAALTDIDLDVWKDWLTWNVVHSAAPLLNSALVEENFAFYGTTLTGAQELRDRWKRGVSLVEGALGEALGRIYVERHFPAESKQHMDRLVDAIVQAYAERIRGLDWMTDETKAKALTKLDLFTPKIGYPDRWRDYTALEIKPGDLIGNARRANAFESDRELAKLDAGVDRGEWFMLPQTVNAYYNPGMNEIVFPAAILQPPFFDPLADDAVNFGGIGAVIAHEVSHGFDDQGSKYDGNGQLENWWTDLDRKEFETRAGQLVDQFDGYETREAPGHKINGALTVGENIGDLGGLTIALRAYEISVDGTSAPVIDGLTGIQRVIFGWAQVWRGKSRKEEAIRLLAIDPHSPQDVRCNAVVRNLPAFYEAFDITESDALWLAPTDRVSIW